MFSLTMHHSMDLFQ